MMRLSSIVGVLVALVAALFIGSADAQEAYVLGGGMRDSGTGAESYTWQLEYMERFREHFAWSFSYLNEGHVPDHHRDGPVFQAWVRTDVLSDRLSLAAGLGPYGYFDTTPDSTGGSYRNGHGLGGVFSLSATWRAYGPWLVQLRGNWVTVEHGNDNISALVGIGYELGGTPAAGGRRLTEEPNRNEVTLSFGQTIMNSFNSDRSAAASLEYRRSLEEWPFEWTVTWLHEGASDAGRGDGLMGQLWLARAFLGDRLSLGIGGGPYLVVDRSGTGDDERLVGVFSMTASYRLDRNWALRLTWSRVVTNRDSDSDVILCGLGYRF
ncbi:MAG: hypothetical protein ABSC19_00185 [Syntrophorhabdales bacterium]|jgi:hypothetical protein